jgi:DNA-binding NarL/FixJ family response regulator
MAASILIVDDHPGFRTTARMLLESEGWDVVGDAEDGERGLECAARLRPEVVLLDVQLPDLDGFEVARRLTAKGSGPAVVMISSRDAADYGSLAADNGARGFIPKSELSGAAVEALL